MAKKTAKAVQHVSATKPFQWRIMYRDDWDNEWHEAANDEADTLEDARYCATEQLEGIADDYDVEISDLRVVLLEVVAEFGVTTETETKVVEVKKTVPKLKEIK